MDIYSGNYINSDPQADAAVKLDAIMRALPALLFSMDVDGRILSYESARPSSFYMLPEDFLGQQMQALLPPEAGERFFQAF